MCKGDGASGRGYPSSNLWPHCPQGFHLDDIQGNVCTIQRVIIPPLWTINIHGQTDISGNCMWVHVLTEPAQDPKLPDSIALAAMYGVLHPGSSWVLICLRNLGAHPIVVPAKVVIVKVTPANMMPLVTLLTGTTGGFVSDSQKDWILDESNLQGLEDWFKNEQRWARELLTR